MINAGDTEVELKNITVDSNCLYFIPLMGQEEEVGQCHLLGTKRAGFILLECGFDSNHAFVDIQPYLNDLRAIFLTHAHDDHMAGLVSYLAINKNSRKSFPPVFALPYTLKKLENDLKDRHIPKDSWPKMFPIQEQEIVKFDNLTVQAQSAVHSIPTIGYIARETGGKSSMYLTGDTTSIDDFSTGTLPQKAISLLVIDATDIIIPGSAKKLDNLSLQIYDLIKDRNENFAFMLPANRPLHVLALKAAAQKAGYGVIFSHTEYKNGFLNAMERTEGKIEVKKDKNIVITDNIQHLSSALGKFKFVFVGRLPKKTEADFTFLSIPTHGLQDDIVKMIAAIDPQLTLPTHCGEKEEAYFRQICQSKQIPHFPRKILNGTIFRMKRDDVILKGRLNNIERIRA